MDLSKSWINNFDQVIYHGYILRELCMRFIENTLILGLDFFTLLR